MGGSAARHHYGDFVSRSAGSSATNDVHAPPLQWWTTGFCDVPCVLLHIRCPMFPKCTSHPDHTQLSILGLHRIFLPCRSTPKKSVNQQENRQTSAKIGQNFALTVQNSALVCKKKAPPPVVAVVTNISYDLVFILCNPLPLPSNCSCLSPLSSDDVSTADGR